MANGRRLAVIGLGYVGLPVAAAFARLGTPVIGFDIDRWRIDELRAGNDRMREVESADLMQPTLTYTCDPTVLAAADFFIVTVPAPIRRGASARSERNLFGLGNGRQGARQGRYRGLRVDGVSRRYRGGLGDFDHLGGLGDLDGGCAMNSRLHHRAIDAHGQYTSHGWPLVARLLKNGEGIVLDVKSVLDRGKMPTGVDLWRL